MNAVRRQDVFVSTGWLEDHLRDPNVRVIDVRWSPEDADWGKRAYTRGHLPGAVYLGSREQMATPDEFCRSMEAAGVSQDTMVIAYDDGGPFHAARLVWRLHYLGHRPASVLDGGFRKWVREGRPVETRVVAHQGSSPQSTRRCGRRRTMSCASCRTGTSRSSIAVENIRGTRDGCTFRARVTCRLRQPSRPREPGNLATTSAAWR